MTTSPASAFAEAQGWTPDLFRCSPVDTGDESQLEGSFMNQGQGERGDINVSYV